MQRGHARESVWHAAESSGTSAGRRQLVGALLLVLALGLTAAVYHPLVGMYFFADDFVCMFNIENLGFFRFFVQPFGGHLLFTRNAVFYLSYVLFGFDPGPYHWMTLLTHLLNVWLFFRVTRRWTGSAALACLGAALWGCSPLCLGTIGWYSVYGQTLVGTIALFLLDRVGMRAERPERIPGRVALGWYVLLLAGVSCFGTGIGVAMVFPAVLFLVVPSAFRQPGLRAAFLGLLVLVPVIYFGFQRLLYPLLVVQPMSEYIHQNAALSRYQPIVVMLWHLVAFAVTGLAQGFAFVPNDYPGTASQVAAPIYLGALALVFVASDALTKRRIAALVLLCLAIYTLVAMGRSNVYLMFHYEPSASARQARYHYVGTIPIAMLFAMMLGQVTRWTRGRWVVPAIALLAWIGVTSHAYFTTGFRIDQRLAIRRYVSTSQRAIAAQIEAVPPGQPVTIENAESPSFVLGPMLHGLEFPGLAGLFVLTYRSNVVGDRQARFVERNGVVLGASRNPATNHRLAGLLVPPDGATVDAKAR